MEFWWLWLVIALFTGVAARERGFDFWFWLLLGILFSVFALITALVIPRTHIRCQDCRENIRGDAKVCKYCGKTLESYQLNPQEDDGFNEMR